MQQTLEVGTADFAAAGEDYILVSIGIGSCVVVCLYDSTKKIGALCHIMLPKYPENSDLNLLRFADTALALAVEKLEEMGASQTNITAQLFGGAHMFHGLGVFINGVGDQNVTAVRQFLEQRGIPIERMDVGGDVGRSVQFTIATGDVNVSTAKTTINV